MEGLVEIEAYVIKLFTKTREKIAIENNPRVVHLKILSCLERIKERVSVTGPDESMNTRDRFDTKTDEIEFENSKLN